MYFIRSSYELVNGFDFIFKQAQPSSVKLSKDCVDICFRTVQIKIALKFTSNETVNFVLNQDQSPCDKLSHRFVLVKFGLRI